MGFDAFISFKNPDEEHPNVRDSEIAGQLYRELSRRGINTFFSNATIQEKCRPDWGKFIDEALASAKVFILVATSVENVNAPWVEQEWRHYNMMIKGGRKDAMMLTVLEGVSPYQLPSELSWVQSYSAKNLNKACDMVEGLLNNFKATPTTRIDTTEIDREAREKAEREAREKAAIVAKFQALCNQIALQKTM